MAPFKLKFRMGSSRSTSQEHDPDPQVNEALLNHHATAIGASSSTIDSAECNSLGSLGTNERKFLLPHKTNNLRLGYLNHNVVQSANETEHTTVPTTPPPSYEHVLEENTRLASGFDLSQQRTLSSESHSNQQSLRNSINLSTLDQQFLALSTNLCEDPDCQENYVNNEQHLQRQQRLEGEHCEGADENNGNIDDRKESIDSTEYLISTNMTAPASEENLIDNCTGDCQQCEDEACGGSDDGCDGNRGNSNDFCDPLLNHSGYCSNESHYDGDYHEHSQGPPEYMERGGGNDIEEPWDPNQLSASIQQQPHQDQHLQQDCALTQDIISNKSSKEIYKDLAKQWGITCKMSDGCRCMECQSHYFDCEFDDNEHQKTDGGLGAGTPMFISEVMHGSACTIL